MAAFQGYKRFIARQMEEAEAAKSESKKRQITPKPGFVIRVTEARGSQKKFCFVNMCQANAVRCPLVRRLSNACFYYNTPSDSTSYGCWGRTCG
jgi:hypothetical protein